jgi:hypothetical protein
MVELIVQLVIIVIWGTMLIINMRRLLRMSHIESLTAWGDRQLRNKLTRVWWWLGREEYWHQVQVDVVRCLQMTLMLFLMIWGTYA